MKEGGAGSNKGGDEVFKSNWARQVSQQSLEKQLRKVNEAADRMEAQGGSTDCDLSERGRNKNKKVLKMGDSLHNEEDWPWNNSDEDWDGVENRGERNKEKRRKENMRKKVNIKKAALIGRCMLGVGPIYSKSYNYFYKITGDFELSKKMVAA